MALLVLLVLLFPAIGVLVDGGIVGEEDVGAIVQADRATAFQNPRLKLNIALGYGGRADIIEAT